MLVRLGLLLSGILIAESTSVVCTYLRDRGLTYLCASHSYDPHVGGVRTASRDRDRPRLVDDHHVGAQHDQPRYISEVLAM